MVIDNFEQHFESCVLDTQHAYESPRNQINSLLIPQKMRL